jgi:predicted metalloprotease with PDZ domain
VHFKPHDLETLIDSPLFAGRYFKQFDLDPGAKVPVRLNVFADNAGEPGSEARADRRHRNDGAASV